MNIVLIEDSLSSIKLEEALLKQQGHTIAACFKEGRSAVKGISQIVDKVDLLIVDVFLEGDLDGIEMVRLLNKHHSIPVIYLTASEEQSVADRARETSPYGFIIKPFNELVFRNTIHIVERRIDAEKRIHRRFAFEQLVSDIYRRLHEPGEADFQRILDSLGSFVYADRVLLYRKEARSDTLAPFALWKRQAEDPFQAKKVSRSELSFDGEKLTDPEDEKRFCNMEAGTYLGMPISLPELDGIYAYLLFYRNEEDRPWSKEDHRLLHLVSQMTGSWWHRQRTERSLKKAQNSIINREKLVSVGLLSAGIIHEIANPLSYVQANVRMMAGIIDEIDCSEGDGADLPEILEETEEGLDRIHRIVSGIRNFSAGGGSRTNRRDWYNLNEGIQSTLLVSRTFIRQSAEIEMDLGELEPLYCYGARINQVLLNLLINAVEAIERSEIKDGKIMVRSGSEKDRLFCSVSDNGPGIDAEALEQLKRGDRSGGFGLVLARDVIENDHGGSLVYGSGIEGRGCSFTFYLPTGKK